MVEEFQDTVVVLFNKEYKLRLINILDRQWFLDELKELNDEFDFELICKTVYRQMRDKSDFKAIQYKDYDMDGNPVEITMGGYKLLMAKITEDHDSANIQNAYVELFKKSNPEMTETDENSGENTGKK